MTEQQNDNLAILKQIQTQIPLIKEQLSKYEQQPQLVAVSKTKPIEFIKHAYQTTGHKIYGENYILELFDKVHSDELKDLDLQWHLIGHIQTNKISKITKIINEGFNLTIESVDSQEIADKINRNIKVHISDEESKTGISIEELPKLIEYVKNCFMTIGDPTKTEETFQKMVELKQKYINQIPNCQLSMGMSHDYLLAAQYGANYVRVGSNIFGPRDYSKK